MSKPNKKTVIKYILSGLVILIALAGIGAVCYFTIPEKEKVEEVKATPDILGSRINSSGRHLLFSGIPINGQISDFNKKMVQELNFELKTAKTGVYRYSGRILGYDAKVEVNYFPPEDCVFAVKMYSTVSKDTEAITYFDNILELYSDKYGKPSQVKSGFNEKGELYRAAVWDKDEGTVYIKLNPKKFLGITCKYQYEIFHFDRINSVRVKEYTRQNQNDVNFWN